MNSGKLEGDWIQHQETFKTHFLECFYWNSNVQSDMLECSEPFNWISHLLVSLKKKTLYCYGLFHHSFPQPTCRLLLISNPKLKPGWSPLSRWVFSALLLPLLSAAPLPLPRLSSSTTLPPGQEKFNWLLFIECQSLLVLLCWLSRAPPSWDSPPCFSPDSVSSPALPVSSPAPPAFSLRSTLSPLALSSFFALPPEIDNR